MPLDSQWVVSYASIIYFGIIFLTVSKLFAILGQFMQFGELKWLPFGHFWSDREKIATMLIPIDTRIIVSGNSKIYFWCVFWGNFCLKNFLSQKFWPTKTFFPGNRLKRPKNHFEWNLNIFDFWPPNFGGFGPPWAKVFNAPRVVMGGLLYIHNTFWCHIPHRFQVICHLMRRSRVPKTQKGAKWPLYKTRDSPKSYIWNYSCDCSLLQKFSQPGP